MDLIALLTRHEGLRLKPYRCTAGRLTIGIGRNLDANGISKDEAEYLLKNDIDKAEAGAKHNFPWYEGLNDARKAVVISMIFNLGLTGFGKFVNTISAIASGQYEKASQQMLRTKWARQVKGRAVELAEMMKTGEWNG